MLGLVGCDLDAAVMAGAGCAHIGDHEVCEPVLSFYRDMGGKKYLGLPLETLRPDHGQHVQCFENGCVYVAFDTETVELAPLGILLGHQTPPLAGDIVQSQSLSQEGSLRYYADTGHALFPLFMEVYDRLGGPEVLGYPIAEFGVCDARRFYQDFERVRLVMAEAHGSANSVQLAALGKLYMERRAALSPPQPTPLSPIQTHLSIHLRYPMPGPVGQQRLDIQLVDDAGRGAEGVVFDVVVHDAHVKRELTTPPTNVLGSTTVSFPLGASPPGYRVFVDVSGSWAGQEIRGRASYLPSASHPSTQ